MQTSSYTLLEQHITAQSSETDYCAMRTKQPDKVRHLSRHKDLISFSFPKTYSKYEGNIFFIFYSHRLLCFWIPSGDKWSSSSASSTDASWQLRNPKVHVIYHRQEFQETSSFLEPNELYIPLGLFLRSLGFPHYLERWISGKSDKNPSLRFQRVKGIGINEAAMAPFPLTNLSTNNLLHSSLMHPQFTAGKRVSRAFQPLQKE